MFNRVIVVAVENHMLANYECLLDGLKQKTKVQIVILPQFVSNRSIFYRLKGRKRQFKYLKQSIKEQLGMEQIVNSLVIYTNSEGFVLTNKDSWMPQLINCKEVMLQHGLMPTKVPHMFARNLVNFVFKKFRGYYLFGNGFGGVKANYIIVWGTYYYNYLVNNRGWESDKVLVSGRLLKLMPTAPQIGKDSQSRKCLFLLQDLQQYYDVTLQKQNEYFLEITNVLSEHYDEVIVRKHPKMNNSVYELFVTNEKVTISNTTLEEEIINCSRVYSFFSSALLDAYLMHKEIVAIYLLELPIDLYRMFKRVVWINELEEYEKENLDDKYASIDNDFFSIENNCDTIINKLFNNDN